MKKINFYGPVLVLAAWLMPFAGYSAPPGNGAGIIFHNGNACRISSGPFVLSYKKGMNYIAVYRREEERADTGRYFRLHPGGGDQALDVFNTSRSLALHCTENSNEAVMKISGKRDWGSYQLIVTASKKEPGLINARIELQVAAGKSVPAALFAKGSPELSYARRYGKGFVFYLNSTPGSYTYHTAGDDRDSAAIVDRNQFVFMGDPSILKATLFQYVDFSSLNLYFTQTGSILLNTVQQPEGCLGVPRPPQEAGFDRFGFTTPTGRSAVRKAGNLLVSNTWLLLQPGVPGIHEPAKYSQRFIEGVAAVYDHIEKPTYKFVDWPRLTDKGLHDLEKLKHDQPGTAIIYPQANLWSLRKYQHDFASAPAEALLTGAEDSWARVQSALPYGDAWQYLYPLVMAGEYAAAYNSEPAKQAFLAAKENVLKVGAALNYVFPLRIAADFSNPGKFRNQYDCTGAFVYLTLLYHEMTGESRFLDSAKKAGDRLCQMGFEFPFEFTTTALGPLAMLRLYKITGDKKYLDAVSIPLAAIFRHSWLFNPSYGQYKGRTIFMLTEGMPGVYTNGWEEAALIRYLGLLLAEGKEMLGHTRSVMVTELLRWKCISGADGLAPLLPDPSIIYTGIPREWKIPIRRESYIPLEGFGYLEWDSSGQHHLPGRVSQSPYCFAMLPEAAFLLFHPVFDKTVLYCEVPITMMEKKSDAVDFMITGKGSYRCRLKNATENRVAVKSLQDGRAPALAKVAGTDWYSFQAEAGVRYRVYTY